MEDCMMSWPTEPFSSWYYNNMLQYVMMYISGLILTDAQLHSGLVSAMTTPCVVTIQPFWECLLLE